MDADMLLLTAAKKMNGDALAQIFDLYARPLYNYAFHLCGNALISDQIVGDVFSKLLDQLSAGGGPRTNLRSYLYEMTYHLVVDEARSYHRTAPIEIIDLKYGDKYSTHMSEESPELLQALLQVIKKDLTADQRHVVILRFLEGFNVKETAAIIGKNITNVKVIQSRALAVLRRALDPQVVEKSSITPGLEYHEAVISYGIVGD
jgi:RNA polymerase sigma-70 factor, ECF subfamily